LRKGHTSELIGQLLITAVLVIFFNLRILTALGAIPSIVLTVLWITAITNAFNFLDNMDGLSAGITIPLPPLAAQREIVAEIEAEQRLVDANRQLLDRMQQKIAATLARIWGEGAESVRDVTAAGGVCEVGLS
jgi:hypothetical protein